MSESFINESGFEVKNCLECKQTVNINSFNANSDICSICHEFINEVKLFVVTEGDYNDVFNRTIIKSTSKQIDEYCKRQLEYNEVKDYDELNSDSIGYIKYYDTIDENDELRTEYYIEAQELETDQDVTIEINLTQE